MGGSATISSSTFMAGDGDGYELQMGRFSRLLAPLFVDFARIRDGRHILDVGCGKGSLTFELARSPGFERIEAVDFSPIYVAHAKGRSDDVRLTFREADACALPFADASFDHAASMLVLAFVPQADQAVREMRRVTKPGGTVAAAMWDTRGGLVFYRLFFDTAALLDPEANDRRAKAYTRPMTRPGELERAWRAAGLENVAGQTLTIRMEFASFSDYWTPFEGKDGPIAAYVGTLDATAKAKLRHMVELAYLDGEEDGPRSHAATAWVVKGTVPA